jgi:UDPglucose 6-dehydrogenase
MHMSAAASEANIATQSRFVERLSASLGGLSERRIGLLGLAFKAGTDDVRESPALNVARMLLDRGASVVAFDPAAGANAVAVEPRLTLADAAERVADDADAIVVATEWRQFRSLDWSAIRASMRRRLVFDGRRLLDAHEMAALGFEYAAVGSPMISGARD